MRAELITRFKDTTADGAIPLEDFIATVAARTAAYLSVRELARAVGRDVKRAHEDVVVLAELGLLERTEAGGVVCPYASLHIDMVLQAA